MDRKRFVSMMFLLTLLIATISLTASVTYVIASPSPASTAYVEEGVYPGAPSYTFWREDSTYYAKDADGHIPTWGITSNASYVIQSAIDSIPASTDYATTGGTLYFKEGIYNLSATVNIFEKYNIRIIGAGKEQTKFTPTTGSDITFFNVTGFNSTVHGKRFEIENCLIDSRYATNTKYGLYIKYMDGVKIHDLAVTGFDTHVYVEDCEDIYVENAVVWHDSTFSYGFYFKGFNIDITMIYVVAIHTDEDAVSYRFETYDSIELVNVIANPTVSSSGSGHGFEFADCHWVHLTHCVSDGNGGAGYYVSSGFGFFFANSWAGSNYGSGLQIDDSGQISISASQFYSNGVDGIKMWAENVTMTSNQVYHNDVYGIEVANSNNTITTENIVRNCASYGIYYGANNDYAIIKNNDATDNLHASYDIYITTPVSGGNSKVSDNFGRLYHAS